MWVSACILTCVGALYPGENFPHALSGSAAEEHLRHIDGGEVEDLVEPEQLF